MINSRMTEGNLTEAVANAIPEPFFVFDDEGYYVQIIGGADHQKYHDGLHLVGKRIHDVIKKELADGFLKEIRYALKSNAVHTYVYQLSAADIKGSEELPGPEGIQWFEAHISPIATSEGIPKMVVWVAFNITEQKKTLLAKESLIKALQKALEEIKTLKGIIPICSHCKKIRDDSGYWNQLEAYIHKHSEASLSHGICPECAIKYYPDIVLYNDTNEE